MPAVLTIMAILAFGQAQKPNAPPPAKPPSKTVNKSTAGQALKPGSKATVSVPFGEVPALHSEAAFRQFILAVRQYRTEELGNEDGERAIMALWPERMTMLKSESSVEIVAVHQVRKYPVPVAEVKARGKVLWVPMAYFKDNARNDVSLYPLLRLNYRDPFPSMETVVLSRRGAATVRMAKDYFAFRALATANVADDAKGKQELIDSGRAFFVDHGTAILVREFHPNAGGKYIDAVEVRILDGPKKDAVGWVLLGNVELTEVKDLSISPSMRLQNP